MNKQEQLTAFLSEHVMWQRNNGQYWMREIFVEVQPRPTAEELAQEWLQVLEFRALRLGTVLNTPDGAMLALAVESVMPPFYRQDVELLVDALKLAAHLQQQGAQKTAGKVALGACGVAALIALGVSGAGKAA